MNRPRVPMPSRASFLTDEDVAVSASNLKVGVRYTMDFDEHAHSKLGKEAVVFAVERLAQEIAYDNTWAIRRTVESYLHDREWAEPIIRKALREAVREHVGKMFDIGVGNE